jgi:hypothetical protein
MRRSLTAVFVVGGLFVSSCTAAQGAFQGVYAFDYITLDLGRGLERVETKATAVVGCSTVELYCVEGHWFSFALPRACADLDVNEEWRVGRVRTKVLADYERPLDIHARTDRRQLLLGDQARPHIVYEYSPNVGVYGVFVDVEEKLDLVGLAEAGTLLELKSQGMFGGRRYYHQITTFDHLAKCE